MAKGKGASNGKGFRKNEHGKGGSKHTATTSALSSLISVDSGQPSQAFEKYSSNLADIIGQLDEAALQRVFKGKLTKLP